MRRVILLAGGVLLAGIGVFARSGASPSASPSASIEGAPLEAKPTPEEVAAFTALAEPAPLPPPLEIDLDKLALVGDHYEAPANGNRRVILTLDPELQATAEKLLVEARAPRGAIVAMAPDGRILALAGRRTEEPKGGTKGSSDWHLATDTWAPAASIFKLVTASALVAAGVDPDDKVCYHGGLRSVNASNLKDDKHDGNCESLTYGVAHSQNAIVGKLAYQRLEPSTLDGLARDLGLGGTLPASLAFHATAGELALPHDKDLSFAQAAAGFSGAKLSVLGGALLAATFADAGEQPTPRIVAQIVDGKPMVAPSPRRVLPETVAKAVGKMMVATCDYGSAARSFGKHRPIKVAGKTGTLTTTDPFYIEHSWFVGYAPADQPQVIVSVLLGNPESWHLRGHEAARRLIDRAVRNAEDHAPDEPHRPAKHVR